ncbi:MAG: T9SS type A sorting domain-containing protein [Ignavibacteria bacterium]|nr:T9SS type A sorting domain-containing protein [Ignavibacteria bacterium]
MTFKYFFVFVFCFISTVLNAQWYPQTTGAVYSLRSVHFTDQNNGWICGLETVLKTVDGGNTWKTINVSGDFNSVYFADANTGWICGFNGKIKKSVNGGLNWYDVNSTVTNNLNQISFLNNSTGFVVGNNSIILRTTDAGESWNRLNAGIDTIDIYAVKITVQQIIFLTGSESMIFKSVDLGNSWNYYSMNQANPFFTVEFKDSNTGYVSGCCGMFLKTIDGGIHWTKEIYLTPGLTLFSMKFIDNNFGMIAGSEGYILRTSDGGMSWDSLQSNTDKEIFSLFLINKDTGFAVGNSGTVLKTTNSGGVGYPVSVNDPSVQSPSGFTLHQNFPNPFNPSTEINFSISKKAYIKIEVFDISGKLISTLANSVFESGDHKLNFSGNDLSSGIYLYRMSVSGISGNLIQNISRSMLLLK